MDQANVGFSAGTGTPPLLATEGLTKRFGDLTACDQYRPRYRQGEIHALARRERRRQVDAGQDAVRRAGARCRARSSGTARRSRISSPRRGAKARHRHGVPAFLAVRGADGGREHRAGAADRAPISELAAKIRGVSRDYGLPLDPAALVADLSVGERQRIEIIRCLLQKPQLIILDEPTSVLTPQEADQLFVTLRRLRCRRRLDPLHLAPAGRGAGALRSAPPCCGTARSSAPQTRARKAPARSPA